VRPDLILENASEPPVQRGALPVRQALVEKLAEEDVHEAKGVAHCGTPGDAGGQRLVEPPERDRGRRPRDHGELLQRELVPDHGGSTEQRATLGRQRLEPALDGVANANRYAEAGGRGATRPPGAAPPPPPGPRPPPGK